MIKSPEYILQFVDNYLPSYIQAIDRETIKRWIDQAYRDGRIDKMQELCDLRAINADKLSIPPLHRDAD